MTEQLQWIISICILAAVGFAAFRGGAANPIGTGKLLHDVNNIRTQVKALEGLPEQFRPIRHSTANLAAQFQGLEHQLGKMATTETLMEFEREIEHRITGVEQRMEQAATREDVAKVRGDVTKVSGDVGRVQESVEHICKQNERTDASVVRIEQHLLGQVGRTRR